MFSRKFLVRYVWDRSGAFLPALVVGLAVDLVALFVVLAALSVIAPDVRSSPARGAPNVAVILPTLFAALLSAMIAGMLAAFNILRPSLERLEDDKLTILARVERLRDGVPLADDERYQTIAILSRRQWCSRTDARALVDGSGGDHLMAYLLDNLAPRSRVMPRAVERLLQGPPSHLRGSSDWSMPHP